MMAADRHVLDKMRASLDDAVAEPEGFALPAFDGDPSKLPRDAAKMAELYKGSIVPAGKELLEYIPVEMFDVAHHIASRGPFLVAKQVLPAMRQRGHGSFFFSNNSKSLRGKKRQTGLGHDTGTRAAVINLPAFPSFAGAPGSPRLSMTRVSPTLSMMGCSTGGISPTRYRYRFPGSAS